ncbi:hypothetical protein JZ751_019976 [Albula glossodonta]|uniref:Uncharacterized protein n=1 Tax=Albula glossodonta TaxID=121402 RepID=A0A8T2MZS5_9TELE|nr:hypothetical protein JZ751_019976 [Albula glossodonta]
MWSCTEQAVWSLLPGSSGNRDPAKQSRPCGPCCLAAVGTETQRNRAGHVVPAVWQRWEQRSSETEQAVWSLLPGSAQERSNTEYRPGQRRDGPILPSEYSSPQQGIMEITS